MKKMLILCFLMIVIASPAEAQLDTLWTRTLGGSSNDGFRSVVQTGDGGFLAVGYTYSFGDADVNVPRVGRGALPSSRSEPSLAGEVGRPFGQEGRDAFPSVGAARRVGDAARLVLHLALEMIPAGVKQQPLHLSEGARGSGRQLGCELGGLVLEFFVGDHSRDQIPVECFGSLEYAPGQHQLLGATKPDQTGKEEGAAPVG